MRRTYIKETDLAEYISNLENSNETIVSMACRPHPGYDEVNLLLLIDTKKSSGCGGACSCTPVTTIEDSIEIEGLAAETLPNQYTQAELLQIEIKAQLATLGNYVIHTSNVSESDAFVKYLVDRIDALQARYDSLLFGGV